MKLKTIIPIVAILLPIVFMSSCEKDDTDDGLRPTIVSSDPLSNQTDVARNKVISITFSEAMDPTTINTSSFTLKQGTTQIVGVVAYSGVTATFTSSSTFNAKSNYTATITTAAKSIKGKTLGKNHAWNFTTGGSTASINPVNLGSAINYVILAKTAINNSGTSAVTGDLGLSPAATSYITGLSLTDFTGYATSAQVTGQVFAADMADPTPINLTTAVNNMITAYNDAAGRTLIDFLELGTGNIGGKTLTPGIYKWTNTVTIPTDVTISGSSTDVWIFQIAQNLTMSSAAKIILSNGAQAKNIFWQVAGQATFGTTSHFEGVILSMTGITFQTGASMNGRALAQTAVVLDGNAITQP
ncbi:MAG: ice-binding family protein [Bacteroidales bacterium]|jgi:hypothetical protein|nr:ice-binding family protein [Bacteroidales bacterium]MDD4385471.1 ice-binding family protein [Bacteroidales bacterium]MDY0196423.1 ice-binding family protein [Tenuifilaceae bacterium]